MNRITMTIYAQPFIAVIGTLSYCIQQVPNAAGYETTAQHISVTKQYTHTGYGAYQEFVTNDEHVAKR